MDAFALAIAQGVAGYRSRSDAMRIGLAFGVAQGIMPAIGWGLGSAFLLQIRTFDHWIALLVPSGLGLKMLWEATQTDQPEPVRGLSGLPLMAAAIATSIDALAAGITFPALELPVGPSCIIIALVTALLSGCGVLIGGIAGQRTEKLAEIVGGIILITLGLKIFVEHQFSGF